MPERRSVNYHRGRVAGSLRDEIVAMVEGELSDPRIGLCTVTDVVLAPGGKAARVYVQVEGDEAEAESTMTALSDARAYIRAQVRERMGVRQVPELTFHLDRSAQVGGRIDELLGRVEKRSRKNQS
jgi:ribosome-binding factor A